MRRLIAALVALTALAVTGCTSVTEGRAIAGEDRELPTSGVDTTGDGYGVILGTTEDAAAEIYIEPQCPHCGSFFGEYSSAMLDEIEGEKLTLTLRPVTFLDGGGNDYSARASNAIFLVAEDEDANPALVMDFVAGLYDDLMSGSTVLSDDDIAQTANDVGVGADTVNRIAAAEPALDTTDMSDANLDHMDVIGATGTPTVYDQIDETQVDVDDPNWLETVVAE